MYYDLHTGELVPTTVELRQLLALGERWQRACVKHTNQVGFEKKNTTGCVCRDAHIYPLKHTPVDSRTGELVVVTA
jgi:hypothetical protein